MQNSFVPINSFVETVVLILKSLKCVESKSVAIDGKFML